MTNQSGKTKTATSFGFQQNRIHSLESSVNFIQQNHRRTLEALHCEIEHLRRRNAEVTFKLTLRDGEEFREEAFALADANRRQIQSELSRKQSVVEDLEERLQRKQHEVKMLEDDLKAKEDVIRELRGQLKQYTVKETQAREVFNEKQAGLNRLLEEKSNTIAYLTTQLHQNKMRMYQQQKMGSLSPQTGPHSSSSSSPSSSSSQQQADISSTVSYSEVDTRGGASYHKSKRVAAGSTSGSDLVLLGGMKRGDGMMTRGRKEGMTDAEMMMMYGNSSPSGSSSGGPLRSRRLTSTSSSKGTLGGGSRPRGGDSSVAGGVHPLYGALSPGSSAVAEAVMSQGDSVNDKYKGESSGASNSKQSSTAPALYQVTLGQNVDGKQLFHPTLPARSGQQQHRVGNGIQSGADIEHFHAPQPPPVTNQHSAYVRRKQPRRGPHEGHYIVSKSSTTPGPTNINSALSSTSPTCQASVSTEEALSDTGNARAGSASPQSEAWENNNGTVSPSHSGTEADDHDGRIFSVLPPISSDSPTHQNSTAKTFV
eukprot:Nk52_evm93s208 gene=Nk52_evmTU93s208